MDLSLVLVTTPTSANIITLLGYTVYACVCVCVCEVEMW